MVFLVFIILIDYSVIINASEKLERSIKIISFITILDHTVYRAKNIRIYEEIHSKLTVTLALNNSDKNKQNILLRVCQSRGTLMSPRIASSFTYGARSFSSGTRSRPRSIAHIVLDDATPAQVA